MRQEIKWHKKLHNSNNIMVKRKWKSVKASKCCASKMLKIVGKPECDFRSKLGDMVRGTPEGKWLIHQHFFLWGNL